MAEPTSADVPQTFKMLVNGQMVGGVDMMVAGAVIGVWCFVLFFGSVLIFRKRELAIYSGQ